jgi:type III secretory pathway component EscS
LHRFQVFRAKPVEVSKRESIIVGSFLGLACPVSFFILGWWSSATLAIYRVFPISESSIAAAAVTGFCIGILLDAFFLRKWTVRFYTFDPKVIVPVYLFWSVVALASLMGLPFANLVLGTLAGLYVGRRAYHGRANGNKFRIVARNASTLTGLVTSGETMPIAFLGLKEPWVVKIIQAITGLEESTIAGPTGIALIVIACLILFVVQFLCTRTAARFAFGMIGMRDKDQTTRS